MSYTEFHSKVKGIKESIIPSQGLEKGISVIIPIYDGLEYMELCLKSLYDQNINDAKFEIVLVLNGKFEEELNYLYKEELSNIESVILINDIGSAGAARNLGISNAKYSHVTFVDIDDYISPNYIQSHYDNIENETITFSQIHDVIDGEIINDNPINQEILENSSKAIVSLMDLNRISTITVCKVIPKELIELQNFRDYLRSGEDTVFYSELFVNSRPKLKIIPLDEESIYYRRIREDSVSRKSSSFDFLIYQRLEILEILDKILNKVNNPTLKKFVTSKYNAQINFMNRYLNEKPNDRDKVLKAIEAMSLNHFKYSILNRGFAKTLVLSYCFPPYSDTSATIVAKRIVNNNEVVDVVSNNMSRIRKKEASLRKIVAPLVGTNIVVNQPASFSNMFYLNSFINTSVRYYAKNELNYNKLYSRAMFPISHLPNLFIKIMNPKIKWTAEFSDPLLYNIESTERYAVIENDQFITSLENGLLGEFSKYVDDNLFNISELIPFALADELIFTNTNQLEYMILRFNENEKNFIREKSKILKHPTLPMEYYHLQRVNLNIENTVINIAYFGNFYSRRGYKQFIDLINHLNDNYNFTFKLHLYTNVNQFSEEELEELNENYINVNEYLSYTEFLNATTQFDILLISDANTKEDKPFNPYLPSKLSDYLGSGATILALTENTSIMSNMEHKNLFKIDIDDFNEGIIKGSLYKNKAMVELVNSTLSLKQEEETRKLKYNENDILLTDKNISMQLTHDLMLQNISGKDWVIKPKSLPVIKNGDYEIVINNHSKFNKVISIKSFYSLKNVVKVEFHLLDKTEVFCISELRKNFSERIIPPNSSLKIKLKYRKDYNKVGFINAGRLNITGV